MTSTRHVVLYTLAFLLELFLVCYLAASHTPLWEQAIGVLFALVVGWRLTHVWKTWRHPE